MSSDNFYFTRDGKVYMGFASDYYYDMEQAEKKAEAKFFDAAVKRGRTYFEGTLEEADKYAHSEYSEYGHWGEH